MKSIPAISVVIPVFNGARTILDTIASVRAQDFEDYEIIVINDGSSDSTRSLVESVADSRLRIFNYQNEGLSATRNRGIDQSRSPFISFVDADDRWTADKLSLQLEALKNNPLAGAAYSWTAFVDDESRFLYARERTTAEGNVYNQLLTSNFIASGSNLLLRRACMDVVGRFDSSVGGGADDWNYWLRFARRWNFVVVRKYQVFYRVASSSMSSNVETMEASLLDVLQREFIASPQLTARTQRASVAWTKQYVAFLHLARTDAVDSLSKARRKLGESVRTHPPVLFARKTQFLLWSIMLLHAVPRTLRARLFRGIMRAYGRIIRLLRPVPGTQ